MGINIIIIAINTNTHTNTHLFGVHNISRIGCEIIQSDIVFVGQSDVFGAKAYSPRHYAQHYNMNTTSISTHHRVNCTQTSTKLRALQTAPQCHTATAIATTTSSAPARRSAIHVRAVFPVGTSLSLSVSAALRLNCAPSIVRALSNTGTRNSALFWRSNN